MKEAATRRPPPSAVLRAEARKLGAFVWRDILVNLSYRTAYAADVANLVFQIVMFYFLARMIDPAAMPVMDGVRVGYLGFVAIGIVLGSLIQVGLGRTIAAIRNEQLMGTLECLFATPTRPLTIQVGLIAYDLVYVPLRTALFMALVSVGLALDLHAAGVLPFALVVLSFIPLMWGLGLIGAGAILAFKRGAGTVTIAGALVTVGAGAYFPLDLFPGWLETIARANPIATAFDASRRALLAGASVTDLAGDIAVMAVFSLALLAIGLGVFAVALRRERRRGTLSLY